MPSSKVARRSDPWYNKEILEKRTWKGWPLFYVEDFLTPAAADAAFGGQLLKVWLAYHDFTRADLTEMIWGKKGNTGTLNVILAPGYNHRSDFALEAIFMITGISQDRLIGEEELTEYGFPIADED